MTVEIRRVPITVEETRDVWRCDWCGTEQVSDKGENYADVAPVGWVLFRQVEAAPRLGRRLDFCGWSCVEGLLASRNPVAFLRGYVALGAGKE